VQIPEFRAVPKTRDRRHTHMSLTPSAREGRKYESSLSLSGREVSVTLHSEDEDDDEEDEAEAMDSRLIASSLAEGDSGGVNRPICDTPLKGVVGGESRTSPGVKGGVRRDMADSDGSLTRVRDSTTDLDKCARQRLPGLMNWRV